MNNVIKQAFLYIASKLGLELAQKTETLNDFDSIDTISVAAAMANKLASITLTGSKMIVEGTSARAQFIQECAEKIFKLHLKKACAIALGTGTALIKPYTDGERFGFDIIPESDYYITKYIGDYISAALLKVGEYEKANHKYELYESQEIKKDDAGTSYIDVKYLALKDGQQCELSETRWNDKADYTIANVDNLFFGRIVCPVLNRKDINSPNGVPITFGNNEAVENVKDSYRQYNREREDKDTMVFADKTLFRTGKDGGMVLPEGKDRIFLKMRGGADIDKPLLDVFSPEIRETPLDSAIERNSRTLELMCGLGEGILSKSTLTYTNMDEVRAMKQQTYSFMGDLRDSIDMCIDAVLEAIDKIANYNGITPQGEYKAYIEWSDEYMSSVSERFGQYLQAEQAGWIEAAEGRAILKNEDIDEARKAVEEIRSTGLIDMDAQFESMATPKTEDKEDTKEEAEKVTGKTLNGAQTQSLLSVIAQYTSGALTLGQAVNILTVSIGVTREEAEKIIQGAL